MLSKNKNYLLTPDKVVVFEIDKFYDKYPLLRQNVILCASRRCKRYKDIKPLFDMPERTFVQEQELIKSMNDFKYECVGVKSEDGSSKVLGVPFNYSYNVFKHKVDLKGYENRCSMDVEGIDCGINSFLKQSDDPESDILVSGAYPLTPDCLEPDPTLESKAKKDQSIFPYRRVASINSMSDFLDWLKQTQIVLFIYGSGRIGTIDYLNSKIPRSTDHITDRRSGDNEIPFVRKHFLSPLKKRDLQYDEYAAPFIHINGNHPYKIKQ